MTDETILGCQPGASFEELRMNYLKLAKQFHPDKTGGADSSSNEQFQQIQFAWQNLIHKFEQASKSSPAILIDLDDMTFNQNRDNYSYKCRCGDHIVAPCPALEEGINVFACNSCSLKIQVAFEMVEDNE